MRAQLAGRIVVGEGAQAESERLHVGEAVGAGGPSVDLAVDALEGTTLCAKNMPVPYRHVVAPPGELLQVPAVYKEKVAIGPDIPPASCRVCRTRGHIQALAAAARAYASEITALVLDRPRHAKLIEAIRSTGHR